MKRNQLQKLLTVLAVIFTFTAQAATINVTGNITTNTNWTNDNIYILYGDIIVKSGATLTIQQGTLIKGDKSTLSRIVVATGAKIVAQGTPNEPIIFTSNQPVNQRGRADWAGIAICGLAPTNYKDGSGNSIQGRIECGTTSDYDFGGSNAEDSSGVISYVRIEYAGFVCGSNSELNSLTMGAVGSRTKIDHVMVSFGQDDGFEFFGGTANVNHIVSYGSRDDDFDSDNGWSGKAQFGLIVRVDTIADQGDISNAFESDNNAAGDTLTPKTSGVISNFTIIGPAATTTSTIDAKYGWGARLRRNTAESIMNSVFIGYKRGLRIENTLTQTNATNVELQFLNNVIAGSVERYAEAAFDSAYVGNALTQNTIYGGNANDSVKLVYPYGTPDLFNFTPQAGSPLLTGASFATPKLTGFESTDYRGAFGTDNWATCWTEFSPQNEDYSTAHINYAPNINITTTGTAPNVTLTADNINGATYAWSTTETGASINVTANGDYTVTVTSSRGCVASKTVTVGGNVGINEVKNIANITLVPNPNNGTAILSVAVQNTTDATISVTEVTGKEVISISKELQAGSVNQVLVNTSALANGIYFVTIKNNSESKTVRMVVSK